MRRIIILLGLLLAACQPGPASPVTTAVPGTPTPAGRLTPYHTATPQPVTQITGTPTPLPSPTPTPFIHIIKDGEDFFGLAYRYGITVDNIITANPNVNPRAMTVGGELVIPFQTASDQTASQPGPDLPAGLTVAPADCWRMAEGGAWCFALAANTGETPLELVTGRFTLQDISGAEPLNRPASTPLDVVAPGMYLPLMAYFPAPVPAEYAISVEVLTALPLADPSERYLPAQVEGLQVDYTADSGLATVSGAVRLGDGAGDAAVIWLAALAYDAGGRLVGVRKLEIPGPLVAGSAVPFQLDVFSAGGAIASVTALAEARR